MIGIATLAALAAMKTPGAIQQKPQSLVQALFPQPSGQNGLEDYMRAIDRMNDDVSVVYVDTSSYRSPFESEEVKAKQARMQEQIKPLDYLAVRQAYVKQYSDAYDLMIEGNHKPVFTPAVTMDSPKGFSSTLQLAQLVRAMAYCESADGKQSESCQTLLSGLTFTQRAGTFNSMAYISSVVGERELYDAFVDELPALSLADADRVAAFVDDAIKQPPATRALIQRSAQVHQLMFNQYQVSDSITKDNSTAYADYRAALANATPAQLSEFTSDVRSSTAAMYQIQIDALAAPENQWYDASGPWKAELADSDATQGKSLKQLAESFSRSLVPSFKNMMMMELKRRAQLRLLGLHARIVAYRWHKHKLPANLEAVAGSDETFDALAGQSFVYEPHADGTYRLYSAGRKETGVVALHYTPAGAKDPDILP